jgi:hypothetical protein
MRDRRQQNDGAKIDKVIMNEYARVTKAESIYHLMREEQEREMHGRRQVWRGVSASYPSGWGGVDSTTSNDAFTHCLLPDLDMEGNAAKRLLLSDVLVTRLNYYLETLYSFMRVMIPLKSSSGELILFDQSCELSPEKEARHLACQEVVRTLQLTGHRLPVELIAGACALWAPRGFDLDTDFYFSALHCLRAHLYRSYFFSATEQTGMIKDLLKRHGIARLLRLAAHLLPMHRLGDLERCHLKDDACKLVDKRDVEPTYPRFNVSPDNKKTSESGALTNFVKNMCTATAKPDYLKGCSSGDKLLGDIIEKT